MHEPTTPSLKGFFIGLLALIAIAITPAWASVAQGLPPQPGQTIQSLQPFGGDFRILGLKTYSDDAEAQFSPVDFAVSYGLFAQPQFASQIRVRQDHRFLTWSIDRLPIPPRQAMQLVGNMHMIPASPQVATQLKQVRRGDYVRLRGDLVQVNSGSLRWRSALRFGGVGEGACQVFRVNSIQWLPAMVTSSDNDRRA